MTEPRPQGRGSAFTVCLPSRGHSPVAARRRFYDAFALVALAAVVFGLVARLRFLGVDVFELAALLARGFAVSMFVIFGGGGFGHVVGASAAWAVLPAAGSHVP